MPTRSILAGVGGYLPERIVTNDELAGRLDTSDAWIRERTGIRQRHIAAPHETCAVHGDGGGARGAALGRCRAGRRGRDHPRHQHARPGVSRPPRCASRRRLACSGGFGFDLAAACAGFIYALSVADGDDPRRARRAACW